MESAATDIQRKVLFLHECLTGNTDNVEEDVVVEIGNTFSEEDGEDEAADVEGVTLPEFLEREQREEEDADYIVGGDDGNLCTYPRGYVNRQAVFVCKECKTDGEAGICFACASQCHKEHKVEALYSKRHFRCDCGNSKFGTFACRLQADRDVINEDNRYNHNYKGVYCRCNRPYPDPDNPEESDMKSCCVCEDWFHAEHIGLTYGFEAWSGFEEFICPPCAEGPCTFLWRYPHRAASRAELRELRETKQEVDAAVVSSSGLGMDESTNAGSEPRSDVVDVAAGEAGQPCKLAREAEGQPPFPPAASVLVPVDGWRKHLCTCADCKSMYERNKVAFLTEDTDSLEHYKEQTQRRREGRGSAEEMGMAAFLKSTDIGHAQKLNLLKGMKQFKEQLTEFLDKVQEEGVVVTPEHVAEFKEKLNASKRQRVG